MTSKSKPDPVVEVAADLATAIEGLNERIIGLNKVQRHERRIRIAVICALIFDFIITPFIGYVAVTAVTNNSATNQALATAQTALRNEQTAVVKACRSANNVRTSTNGLFDYLFNELLFDGPTIDPKVWNAKLPTIQAKEYVAAIYYHTAGQYVPIDCSKVK